MTDSKQQVRTGRQRRGVSLIEVLVVLAILVLGILIIVRLFPSGFFAVESAGNSALGNSLGVAAIQNSAQDARTFPQAIMPGGLDVNGQPNGTAADADYDPSDLTQLDQARLIFKETITVPSPNLNQQSVYIASYGPMVFGTAAAPLDPAGALTQLPQYLSINSALWQPMMGDSTLVNNAQVQRPQDTLQPGEERFLVDFTSKKIAVPYAAYTMTGTGTASAYDQRMVAQIVTDGGVYTRWLDVKAGLPKDTTNPNAPHAADNVAYLADTADNYHGGWFSPDTEYLDASYAGVQPPIPAAAVWQQVTLYRPFQGLPNNANSGFTTDPYQFKVLSQNLGGTNTNPGAIEFNPLASGGRGRMPLQAQLSYQTFSWGILREDRDIPALSGTDTTAVRLTLKNIKRAGDADQDNNIYTGLVPNSNQSLVIEDLDTGKIVAPSGVVDPTAPDKPLNDEDLNGISTDSTMINISYATGRLTFGSNVFGDNPGGSTPHAHRVRIYYRADDDWTVAVQKAPSYYVRRADIVNGADPQLRPAEFAVDPSLAPGTVYFPRNNAGRTVEISGTYLDGRALKSFTETIAIPAAVTTLGTGRYVSINLGDAKLPAPLPTTAANVNVTAVRGLSARAVVSWKERNTRKVRTVDTILTRPE